MIVGPHSTKLPHFWDTELDQLDVPAVSPLVPQVFNEAGVWQTASRVSTHYLERVLETC